MYFLQLHLFFSFSAIFLNKVSYEKIILKVYRSFNMEHGPGARFVPLSNAPWNCLLVLWAWAQPLSHLCTPQSVSTWVTVGHTHWWLIVLFVHHLGFRLKFLFIFIWFSSLRCSKVLAPGRVAPDHIEIHEELTCLSHILSPHAEFLLCSLLITFLFFKSFF